MRVKFFTLVAALLLLGACETTPEVDEGQSSGGAASTTSGTGTTAPESEPLPGPPPGSQEELTVQVGDRMFFDFDSSELLPKARATIEMLATWMNNNPGVTLTVEGHCDERGTREYNLALGERRASAVRDYLVALGIAPNRLATISYGKERPAVLGSNDYAWSQNRRGQFVVN